MWKSAVRTVNILEETDQPPRERRVRDDRHAAVGQVQNPSEGISETIAGAGTFSPTNSTGCGVAEVQREFERVRESLQIIHLPNDL